MPHIAQLRLASPGLRPLPGIWIGARFMGLVLALFPAKVDVSSRPAGLARSILGPEDLVAGPSLNQRSIHGTSEWEQLRILYRCHRRA
jgi:hypothetical protein